MPPERVDWPVTENNVLIVWFVTLTFPITFNKLVDNKVEVNAVHETLLKLLFPVTASVPAIVSFPATVNAVHETFVRSV